ncbi:AglZ/HisF2 family acetamidino modification protein [Dyadobacter alkalitolerans]|uniref:AglZ/HisF2 family acetamidino modification protein n=1 Tax=Dyadobacter alkalitolerans TaxID=492736 RepID=UPI000407FE64|nr:AglZ/HisF2 family acetamidino modification protein [Dyadobacter alkalitolerans]
MFRPRVIPVLLLKGRGLVKSVQFKDYRYLGDPINAVKIFNDLRADELVLLDILATREKRMISLDLVQEIGDEANMPFGVGGGIRSIKDIKAILNAGAEKVIINSYAFENPDFIREAADVFGSSTIVVSMDVKKKFLGKEQVYVAGGTKSTGISAVEWAQVMQAKGAGEIIVNSIEQDGKMEGYDLRLIKQVSQAVDVPVVALGGAGNLRDLNKAVRESYASAVAAGSLFVYHGPRRAVLVNYPGQVELLNLFDNDL